MDALAPAVGGSYIGTILKMNGRHKHRLCSHMNIKICDFCPMYVVPENTVTLVDEHKT